MKPQLKKVKLDDEFVINTLFDFKHSKGSVPKSLSECSFCFKNEPKMNIGNLINAVEGAPFILTKEEIGTATKPFPKLEHKLRSEHIQKNADGFYVCDYEGCGKKIRGNKGNLSSHMRSHTKKNKVVQTSGYEQLYKLDGKPRGDDLSYYTDKYGVHILRKDVNGDYLCFYKNCSERMLTNYSRHLATHEQNNDLIEQDLSLCIFKGF
ncbi:hypothetical protein CYY_007888 [Polysphondylium violaceum]|uniref:C2H2-type domain-containing protein n=1 Tax=Polysphondylium violaceum TaxID=133409 RepID=A0A8J4PMY4_9MYCE|nr:hypothetical protein CYY_007888 [Polysphondylium violaceum]